MNGNAKKLAQSAYTADEIARFLGALDLEMVERLPAGKQEVARDVVAAVHAAVVEYGLNARYVANGVGKTAKSKDSRIVIDRNRAKLAGHHAQSRADRHETTVTEVADRSMESGRSYTLTCSCGWERKGYDYRFTATEAGSEHRIKEQAS